MDSVTLLLAADGKICSVYADRAAAEARRDRFNADPFIEPGTPDPDAPYSTKTWGLTVE